MKKTLVALLFSLLFLLSCANFKSSQDQGRELSSSISKAVVRVASKCGISESYINGLVIDNAVEGDARYLNGGSGFQTFLMKDGRLVIVGFPKKGTKRGCKFDHLRLDEGPIKSTFANGRRLFLAVENKNQKTKSRVYLMTAIKNQSSPEPYQVHELKYSRTGSFAQASGFKRETVRVGSKNKYGVSIIKNDGTKYAKRVFKPWEWGDNNETIDKYGQDRVRKIQVRDQRRDLKVSIVKTRLTVTKVPTVTYLPKPVQTCEVEKKVSFFFGLFTRETTREVPCQSRY